MATITFGTSGHRGIMEDTFTHEHVKAIAYGVAQTLKKDHKNPACVIGSDPRQGNDPKLSELSFTKTLIDELNKYGIHTISYDDFVPTPLISWAITEHHYSGGLILTASHNPPDYNGIKFNPENGAPAPKSITESIEKYANSYTEKTPISETQGLHQTKKAPFKAFSKALVDSMQKMGIPLPSSFSKSLLIDVKHGSSAEIWKECAKLLDLNITLVHEEPLPNFGNINPNPTKYKELIACSKEHYFTCANDPDADRHAVLAENNHIISPEEITTIIIDYLISKNMPPSGVSSTLASSHLIKNSCAFNSIPYFETEVGFKYFAPYLEKAKENNTCLLAVESSGGFSTSFHTFEKCGFLPIICLLGILESTQKSITELKNISLKKYGVLHFKEDEFNFTPQKKESFKHFFTSENLNSLQHYFPTKIDTLNQKDGLKLEFTSGSWVLCRMSGTEPLIRIYAESSSQNESLSLIQHTKEVLNTL
ncbi:hypothetical protein DID78_00865 [Candidatus Marinamargulisbacteria bacterium SCGC AG-343-D04]|nr:hypothetical protein DID78_00865 [Candidatus Marinamargulisbacteria bacterium SCGC AG-343-D04]